jgi:hypothetical protein
MSLLESITSLSTIEWFCYYGNYTLKSANYDSISAWEIQYMIFTCDYRRDISNSVLYDENEYNINVMNAMKYVGIIIVVQQRFDNRIIRTPVQRL